MSFGTKSPCWDARNVLWARWLHETNKILNSHSLIQGQFQKVLNTPFLTGQKTFYGQPEAEISNASGTQRTLSFSYSKLCLQWFSFELFDILLLNLHGCEYRGRQLNCTCLQSLLSNKYRDIIQRELNWDKNTNCQKAISVRYLAWLRSWTMDCREQFPHSRNC